MSTVAIRGVGFLAPGLIGWEAARACLAGAKAYAPEPLPKLSPDWLPANERRRLSHLMRLALTVGQEAVRAAGDDPQTNPTVFASATGDGDIIHAICEELTRPEPTVSPTQFHNSVHNAPAGYWSIAARSHSASTAIAAHDASFASGMIEAATLAGDIGGTVLFVAYDRPLPFPLGATRPVAAPFGCALLLDAAGGESRTQIALEPSVEEETHMSDQGLEVLRAGNPAARSLPLFALLARGESGRAVVPWVSGRNLGLELFVT